MDPFWAPGGTWPLIEINNARHGGGRQAWPGMSAICWAEYRGGVRPFPTSQRIQPARTVACTLKAGFRAARWFAVDLIEVNTGHLRQRHRAPIGRHSRAWGEGVLACMG